MQICQERKREHLKCVSKHDGLFRKEDISIRQIYLDVEI
jgi:hypothetical protein